MKKSQLIALGMLPLSVLAFEASAEVKVYGKANVSLNMHDAEDSTGATTQDNWQLNSNASRLGVKGSMDLEDGLSAIYKMEYEVAIDDGTAQTKGVTADCAGDDTTATCASVSSSFKQRNIFVGLKGDFGSVIAGKHDTPLKLSQGKIDRFNDLPLGDIKNVVSGEVRADNIVMYSSPEKNGFDGKLAFMPGEDNGTDADDDNGIADSMSASLRYKADDFWLALASDSEVKGNDAVRVSAEYDFGGAKVGGIIQTAEPSETTTSEEESGVILSGQYKLDNWVLKGQYNSSSFSETGETDIDTTMLTLGADYKLSKKAKLYAYTSSWEEEQGTDSNEESTFGLGAEVKF